MITARDDYKPYSSVIFGTDGLIDGQMDGPTYQLLEYNFEFGIPLDS